MNQKAWGALVEEFHRTGGNDVWLYVAYVIFLLVLFLAIIAIRWLLHLRRRSEVGRRVVQWCNAMGPTFRSQPPTDQLAYVALLRDLSGHPVYVVHHLVLLRVGLERLDLDVKVLEAVDEIAEERHQRTFRKRKTLRSASIDSIPATRRDR